MIFSLIVGIPLGAVMARFKGKFADKLGTAFIAIVEALPTAVLMLFLFSLGQGLILIIAGVFTSSLKGLKSFSKISEYLLKFSGVLLIFSALYIYYKIFSPLL